MVPKVENDKKPQFQKDFEASQARTQKALKAFNIDDFVGEVNAVRTVDVPSVGRVLYKLLSYAELKALHKKLDEQKITEADERGIHIIAEMMYKADNSTTAEKLIGLSGQKVNALVSALGVAAGFL